MAMVLKLFTLFAIIQCFLLPTVNSGGMCSS